MDRHTLAPLFEPASILLFAGAADGHDTAPARHLRAALQAGGYEGRVHALDIDASGTLAEFAQSRADLALIALPPARLAGALEAAARIGCRSAVVLGNGLAAEPADELHRIARRDGLLLLGPNTLGFQSPSHKLNASCAGPLARPGTLALVSQSGALTASMLDWARQNAVGFSRVVSLGPNPGIDLAQVLDYLAHDRQTQSIVLHLEGIRSGRRFMSALRSAANAKPVVVLKAGRRSAGNDAAQTHSGAIVGNDEAFDAALSRAGAVRVRSFVELFSAAKALASRWRPVGRRLAVVTNGGGPGVLAADGLQELGLELGRLTPQRADTLKAQLPPQASLSELVDISEDALPAHYEAAALAADADPQIDAVLVIHSPKPDDDTLAIAQALVQAKARLGKPLFTCWMGDASVGPARAALSEAGIPSFRTPESAVGAFGNLATFYRNQRLLQQTPPPLTALAEPDLDGARLVIDSVLAERRTVLTEMESKTLLSAFHVPVTQTLLARTANEAMMIATQLGFPVALKIDSPDVSHKSDVQGVVLDVMHGAAVRDHFTAMIARVKRLQPEARLNGVTVQKMARAKRGREVCIGLVRDEAFGPMIVFGAGGTMIELIDDRAMELPPLNQYLARGLVERTRVHRTLDEWRGAAPVDREALEQVLLRVSEMACELPQLREMDINPLIVDEHGAVAVDARIVLDPTAVPTHGYQHLAILPYPSRYEQLVPLRGGGEVLLRPVHPDDAQMLQALVTQLTPESRYFRFVSSFTELPPALLSRFTLIDYDREMAMVAVLRERSADTDGNLHDSERIVGVSRYVTNPDQTSCEFSLLVADQLKGRGLGSRLMQSIMQVARDRGLQEIDGLVLANNATMLQLMRHLGFAVKVFEEDPDFKWVSKVL
jgi:acetyltransferase